jgi:hypothetical protein
MRPGFLLLHGLFLLLVATSCLKKEEPREEKVPVANFSADKPEYNAGDVISLTNTSADAETFRWTLPNGETSRERNVAFQTSLSGYSVTVQFKLEAFSRSGEKSDFIVRNFTLKPTMGNVVLYGSQPTTTYWIAVDGAVKGNYSVPYSSAEPLCSYAGFPVLELPSGPHVITGGVVYEQFIESFTITPRGCVAVRVP